MENYKISDSWETVVIPADAIERQFVHEKTGRELTEIVLPDKLPEHAPDCGGWHFYMPTGCVKETETGMRVQFPPSWITIRFLSPFVRGKRSQIIEYPIEDALALLREIFEA
jgi:hypothetical protein